MTQKCETKFISVKKVNGKLQFPVRENFMMGKIEYGKIYLYSEVASKKERERLNLEAWSECNVTN